MPITSEQWSVPVFRAFDLTAAERSEHYSDGGQLQRAESRLPLATVCDKQLHLSRQTYAKSFLAPNLFSESGPTDTRQPAGTIIGNVFGSNYNVPFFNGEDGNNPGIKPVQRRPPRPSGS